MKTKKFDKKLGLNKRTISQLNITAMNSARGGVESGPNYTDCDSERQSCNPCTFNRTQETDCQCYTRDYGTCVDRFFPTEIDCRKWSDYC